MYTSAEEMEGTIDEIAYGIMEWEQFEMRYTGPITPETPAWKLKTYTVYARNPLTVAENIAGSPDFENTWDYVPYEHYTAPGVQRYSNLMSGRWAFRKAVCTSRIFVTY